VNNRLKITEQIQEQRNWNIVHQFMVEWNGIIAIDVSRETEWMEDAGVLIADLQPAISASFPAKRENYTCFWKLFAAITRQRMPRNSRLRNEQPGSSIIHGCSSRSLAADGLDMQFTAASWKKRGGSRLRSNKQNNPNRARARARVTPKLSPNRHPTNSRGRPAKESTRECSLFPSFVRCCATVPGEDLFLSHPPLVNSAREPGMCYHLSAYVGHVSCCADTPAAGECRLSSREEARRSRGVDEYPAYSPAGREGEGGPNRSVYNQREREGEEIRLREERRAPAFSIPLSQSDRFEFPSSRSVSADTQAAYSSRVSGRGGRRGGGGGEFLRKKRWCFWSLPRKAAVSR